MSLNTKIIIAERAPSEAKNVPISLPVSTDRIKIIPINQQRKRHQKLSSFKYKK